MSSQCLLHVPFAIGRRGRFLDAPHHGHSAGRLGFLSSSSSCWAREGRSLFTVYILVVAKGRLLFSAPSCSGLGILDSRFEHSDFQSSGVAAYDRPGSIGGLLNGKP